MLKVCVPEVSGIVGLELVGGAGDADVESVEEVVGGLELGPAVLLVAQRDPAAVPLGVVALQSLPGARAVRGRLLLLLLKKCWVALEGC